MLIQAPTVDYSSTTMQARIADAMAAVGASKFVDGASAESWLVHYLATCDGVTYACSGAGFYTGVDAWLTTAGGRRFAMDVSWADAAKTSIKASRMRFMETATNFARDAVEAYAVSQAVTQPYHDDLGLNLFNPKYMPFELDEIARTSWLLSLAMSAAGLVLALMLIFHPLIAITTTASIFAIQLMMMALFNLVGLRIGPMMIFNVSCAFGIASDSMVHVLHLWTCLRKRGAPPTGYDSHVQAVMAQLGTPIFFAGISTMGMFACFGPLAGAFAHIVRASGLELSARLLSRVVSLPPAFASLPRGTDDVPPARPPLCHLRRRVSVPLGRLHPGRAPPSREVFPPQGGWPTLWSHEHGRLCRDLVVRLKAITGTPPAGGAKTGASHV